MILGPKYQIRKVPSNVNRVCITERTANAPPHLEATQTALIRPPPFIQFESAGVVAPRSYEQRVCDTFGRGTSRYCPQQYVGGSSNSIWDSTFGVDTSWVPWFMKSRMLPWQRN
jgi:hypothetical protein